MCRHRVHDYYSVTDSFVDVCVISRHHSTRHVRIITCECLNRWPSCPDEACDSRDTGGRGSSVAADYRPDKRASRSNAIGNRIARTVFVVVIRCRRPIYCIPGGCRRFVRTRSTRAHHMDVTAFNVSATNMSPIYDVSLRVPAAILRISYRYYLLGRTLLLT